MWVDITAQDLLAARGKQDKVTVGHFNRMRSWEHYYKWNISHYLKKNSNTGIELYFLNKIQECYVYIVVIKGFKLQKFKNALTLLYLSSYCFSSF